MDSANKEQESLRGLNVSNNTGYTPNNNVSMITDNQDQMQRTESDLSSVMPFSLGPIGGGAANKQQDIRAQDGAGQADRYDQQDKDNSMMANDISAITGNDVSGNLGSVSSDNIPPELAFHEPEPIKEKASPRNSSRRSSKKGKRQK
jgi:hypothetical protein